MITTAVLVPTAASGFEQEGYMELNSQTGKLEIENVVVIIFKNYL